MNKLFQKVPLDDCHLVYEIYCQEEGREVTEKGLKRAREIYEDLLARGNYTFACYIDEKIVGVVNIYKNMQYYPTDLQYPYVHLECVIIAKEYQNQGIGTELIRRAIELVIEEGCTYIIGQSSVPAMQRVFYKAGLTNTNDRNFYKDHCCELTNY